jgi:hypothetical protein
MSSCSRLGACTTRQTCASPRSNAMSVRSNQAASSRSVSARRARRSTSRLAASSTRVSTPCPHCHRCRIANTDESHAPSGPRLTRVIGTQADRSHINADNSSQRPDVVYRYYIGCAGQALIDDLMKHGPSTQNRDAMGREPLGALLHLPLCSPASDRCPPASPVDCGQS